MKHPSYLLPSSAVRARYGISSMTIWRWLKNETLDFPKPVVLNKRNYWKLAELEAWEASRTADGVDNGAAKLKREAQSAQNDLEDCIAEASA